MTDVATEYQLLTVGDAKPLGDQFRVRRLAHEGVAMCMVAIDAAGQRHLLVRALGERVAPDTGSQGVTLRGTVRSVDGEDVLFADLHCRIASLDLVFERLVEDVLRRLDAEPHERPEIVCRVALGEWRSLLKSAGSSLPREVLVGLTGELVILSHMMTDPSAALDAWTGPERLTHDFSTGSGELEVKSTAAVDGTFISLSNLDQLDPTGLPALHLAVVHLREDKAGASLDERIRSLLDAGAPRDRLLKLVEEEGYVYESGTDEGVRFSVRSVRAWRVDDGFPGLRRGEIGRRLAGVSNVRYELALDAAPPPISDAEKFFAQWLEGTC